MSYRVNYQPIPEAERPKLKCDPKLGRTKSEFAHECDIKNIMTRFEKTGVLPELIKKNPVYGDFAEAPTYQESLNTVLHAQEQFSALPSKVRARFGNDPQEFLTFASDASNAEEMVKLGLAVQRPPQAPPTPPQAKPKVKKSSAAAAEDKQA